MKKKAQNAQPLEILNGWKEIANYLGKGVRTVQRYERELGLPVRRPAAKDRGAVVATKAELDAWISASPLREGMQLLRREVTPSEITAQTIKKGVAEMVSLRQQMSALRDEWRSSLQRVHESLYQLRTSMAVVPAKRDFADDVKESAQDWENLYRIPSKSRFVS